MHVIIYIILQPISLGRSVIIETLTFTDKKFESLHVKLIWFFYSFFKLWFYFVVVQPHI